MWLILIYSWQNSHDSLLPCLLHGGSFCWSKNLGPRATLLLNFFVSPISSLFAIFILRSCRAKVLNYPTSYRVSSYKLPYIQKSIPARKARYQPNSTWKQLVAAPWTSLVCAKRKWPANLPTWLSHRFVLWYFAHQNVPYTLHRMINTVVSRQNLSELERYIALRVRFRVRPRRLQLHAHIQLWEPTSLLYPALAFVHFRWPDQNTKHQTWVDPDLLCACSQLGWVQIWVSQRSRMQRRYNCLGVHGTMSSMYFTIDECEIISIAGIRICTLCSYSW